MAKSQSINPQEAGKEDATGNTDQGPEQPGRIPNAKAPKTRPPESLRDRLGFLHCSMPKFSGPYSVGTMEIEVPVEKPRSISDIKREHVHLLRLETSLFTVYYPCAHGSGQGRDPSGSMRWSRETWLPRPRVGTAHGYGRFAGVGPAVIPFFAATSMFTKLPAYRNAHLADHWPPHGNVRTAGRNVKYASGAPPPGEAEQPTFPLMIFSHGLGGTRSMYSSLCGEFASYGFIVVAVEHRDGSGPRTYVNHPKNGLGSIQVTEKVDGIEHTAKARRRRFDMIEYVFPRDNPADTSPNNDKGVDYELRDAQLELRICEIEEAYRVVTRIANGEGEAIAKMNLRCRGYKGSSTRGLKGVDWARWKNRIYLDDVTISGHSFGAATAVELLRKYPKRFPQLKQGIIYDIWSAPIKAEDEHRGEKDKDPVTADFHINRPLLAINSEAFTYWRTNFEMVNSIVQEARQQNVLAWLMTVRGTVHVNQSDFPVLYPRLCSWALKMTANPRRAIDLNIDASLEFLRIVMPARIAQIDRVLDCEGLLQTAVLDPSRVPHQDLRRPDKKWIAARLRIPNEMRWRLSPTAKRRAAERRRSKRTNQRQKQHSATGDEIWMHVAPTPDELRRLARRESVRMGVVSAIDQGTSDDPDDVRMDPVRIAMTNSSLAAMDNADTSNDAAAADGDADALKSDAEQEDRKEGVKRGKKSLIGRIEQKLHIGTGFD